MEMIIDLLMVGEENAITCKKLADISESDPREIRECINRERLQGEPICASSKGYFKPKTIDDLKKTTSRLFKQSREVRKVAVAMKKCTEMFDEKNCAEMQKKCEEQFLADLAMERSMNGGEVDE